MFDFRLKVFYTVAKKLSFTKAAEELYISQPAITKHIKELETQLAIRLFERRGSRISLTRAGEILLEKAQKVFQIYDELEYEISELRGKISGKLRLGASSTISQWVIPEILSKFNKSYPAIEISLMNGNSKQVEEALYANEIDLGIVEGNKTRKDLRYNIFKSDILIPVVSSESKLAEHKKITIDEFVKIPLILRERGSGTLDVILKTLNDNFGLSINDLNVIMHLGSTESIKSYLYHSEAMAIISCAAVRKEIESGLLTKIKIEGVRFKRFFRFVCPQGTQKTLNAKFIAFAKRHYNL
jgi:DNA-binding transcriptional LysR family regulator